MKAPREIIREEAQRIRGQMPAGGEIAAHYERACPERREAFDDALVYLKHRIAGPKLHVYPSFEVGALHVLGKKPEELAPELTKQEARRWIKQSEHSDPCDWLASEIKTRHELPKDSRSDSVPVWRWVDKVMASKPKRESMFRERDRGTFALRLDELSAEDLTGSVSETFRNAEVRNALATWDGPNELVPEEPWHKELPKGVKVLRTALELFQEGQQQCHCVADYAERVYERRCLIVRVSAGDCRSTAEIVDGKVTQHLGARNSQPDEACVKLLSSVKR